MVPFDDKIITLWRADEPFSLTTSNTNIPIIQEEEHLDIAVLEKKNVIILLADSYWERSLKKNPPLKDALLHPKTTLDIRQRLVLVCSPYSEQIIKERLPTIFAISTSPQGLFKRLPFDLDFLAKDSFCFSQIVLQKLDCIFKQLYLSHDNFMDKLIDLSDDLENISIGNFSETWTLWEEKIAPTLQVVSVGYKLLLTSPNKIPEYLLQFSQTFEELTNTIERMVANLRIIQKFNSSRETLIEGMKAIANSVIDDIETIRKHIIQIRKTINTYTT